MILIKLYLNNQKGDNSPLFNLIYNYLPFLNAAANALPIALLVSVAAD